MEFNKSIFDNTFKTIGAIQDQSEKMLATFVSKADWLPDDGKKTIINWIAAYKKGRDDFKSMTDDKYKEVVNYFSKQENTTAPVKKH